MNELEKLIADSIEACDTLEAERRQKEDEEEDEYQALLQEATQMRLAELVDQIPHELLPYCEPIDAPKHYKKSHLIQKMREEWRPEHFRIVAPGLSPIFFSVGADWDNEAEAWGAPYIKSLSASAQYRDEYKKWFLAIAAAARIHAERTQQEAEELEYQARKDAAPEERKTPGAAERLESLIREIARAEWVNREE